MANNVDLKIEIDKVAIELSNLPAILSKNGRRRSHWKAQMQATRDLREKAYFTIMVTYQGWELPKFEKAHIHVREKWSNNPHDFDGLASLVAPAIDAFTDMEVIPDDSPRFIESYTMSSVKVAKRADSGVEITVSRA